MIILLTLITISLGNIWILLGENWCWSLSGLKGLIKAFLHPTHLPYRECVCKVYIVLSFGFKITRLPSLTLKDGNLKKLLSSRKISRFFKYVRFMVAKCHISMATTLSPVRLILHFRHSEPKIVNFADPW